MLAALVITISAGFALWLLSFLITTLTTTGYNFYCVWAAHRDMRRLQNKAVDKYLNSL